MKSAKRIFVACAVVMGIVIGSQQRTDAQPATQTADKPMMTPVKLMDGKAKLSPANTKIEFVGTHVAEDPQPRLGGFKTFSGEIKTADDHSALESLMLEIDVNSLWTEFDKLTGHLKNADFFETDKYGKAKFVSTKIARDDKGMLTVTGDLTLHGTTSEVSFPARAKMDDSGVMLMSEFKLDRTKFGMDKMTSGVDSMVSIKFVVGQKTEPKKSMAGPGTEKKEDSERDEQTSATRSISLNVPNME